LPHAGHRASSGELELVGRQDALGLLSELVEQHIPHHTAQPRLGTSWIAHLLGALQCPLDPELDDLFRIDTRATALADEPQKVH
jgi:hypothetical protein